MESIIKWNVSLDIKYETCSNRPNTKWYTHIWIMNAWNRAINICQSTSNWTMMVMVFSVFTKCDDSDALYFDLYAIYYRKSIVFGFKRYSFENFRRINMYCLHFFADTNRNPMDIGKIWILGLNWITLFKMLISKIQIFSLVRNSWNLTFQYYSVLILFGTIGGGQR